MAQTSRNSNNTAPNGESSPATRKLFGDPLMIIAAAMLLALPMIQKTCLGAVPSDSTALMRQLAATATAAAPNPHQVHLLRLANAITSNVVSTVTRIEEDWELNVDEPNEDTGAPQVGTVMTPFSSTTDLYVTFVLNHRFNPSYAAGGLEVQAWYRGVQLDWGNAESQVLHHSGETVTWTQRIESHGDSLQFEIVNGQSDTWGSFGSGLRISVPVHVESLPYYNSKLSVANSGITFASHRVRSMILKEVRGYAANGGLVFQESDPVVVYGDHHHDDE